MLKQDADEPEARQLPPLAILERIASVLVCTVQDFMNGGSEALQVRGASELLTIWPKMENDGDRNRLLVFARQLAASR